MLKYILTDFMSNFYSNWFNPHCYWCFIWNNLPYLWKLWFFLWISVSDDLFENFKCTVYIININIVYYSTKVLKRIENCGEKNQQKSWIRNQSGSTIDNICSTFRKKVVRKRLYWQTVLKLRFCGLGWVTVIRSHCRSVTEGFHTWLVHWLISCSLLDLSLLVGCVDCIEQCVVACHSSNCIPI